jgi:hypothetical protein
LAGIRVGGEETRKTKDSEFWPTVLGGLTGARLKKEEADRAERRVREQNENGERFPIRFGAKVLSERQRGYTQV